MVNDSYFRFDDDDDDDADDDDDVKIKYTFSQSWQAKMGSWRHTAPYIEWYIDDRYQTEYEQSFNNIRLCGLLTC